VPVRVFGCFCCLVPVRVFCCFVCLVPVNVWLFWLSGACEGVVNNYVFWVYNNNITTIKPFQSTLPDYEEFLKKS